MITTIFIVIIVSIILFLGINSITKTNLYLNSKKSLFLFEEKGKNTINTILKYDALVNSDGLGNDLLNCSGGLIINNSIGTICSGKWQTGNDGIDDSCNNDDKTPYFYNKSINISNLIDNNSILYDNDANARVFNIGFIYPNEEKTIFYFDENIKNSLILDNNNSYFNLPNTNRKINLELYGAPLNGDLKIYTINKSTGNNYIKTSSIILNSKGILNDNGNFSFGQPYMLDFTNSNKAYAITIKNSNNAIIPYKITLEDVNDLPIYQLPIKYNQNTNSLKYYDINTNFNINSIEIYK